MIKAKSVEHKSLSEKFGVGTSVSVFTSMSHKLNIAMYISTHLNGMNEGGKRALMNDQKVPQE